MSDLLATPNRRLLQSIAVDWQGNLLIAGIAIQFLISILPRHYRAPQHNLDPRISIGILQQRGHQYRTTIA